MPEEGCETIPGRVVFGRSQRPVLAVFVCDNPAVAVAMVQFDCSRPADQVDKTTIDCPCVSVLRQVTEIIGPLDRVHQAISVLARSRSIGTHVTKGQYELQSGD